MNSKYLYTIKWSQPYAGNNPFMLDLWNRYESMIEQRLARGEFIEANKILHRIQNASKGK